MIGFGSALLVGWLAVGSGPGPAHFSDITESAAVGVSHPYTHIAGVALFDWDLDGLPDLFAPGGANPDTLFRNRGDGTFEDVTAQAGLGALPRGTVAVAVGDVTGDGRDDLLLVPEDGTGRPILLVAGEDGVFTDESALRLVVPASLLAGVALGDLDGDGDLDAVLPRWGPNLPTEPRECLEMLYLENRAGALVHAPLGNATLSGCSLAALFTDFDDDGDLDLLQANDYGPQFTPNQAVRNDGVGADGALVVSEVGAEVGLDTAVYGMGLAVGDVDGDLRRDYFTTSVGIDALLIGDADGTWRDETDVWQAGSRLGPDGTRFKWGAAFLDADNDGHQDLVVAAGMEQSVIPWTGAEQPSVFLQNSGAPPLIEASEAAGLALSSSDRTVAVGDLDADGRLDLVFGTTTGPRVLQNDTPEAGAWTGLRLTGTVSNVAAIGARVVVTCGGNGWLRELSSGGNPGATHQRLVHVGLGGCAGPASATIRWPSGYEQVVDGLAIGAYHEVTEPAWLTVGARRVQADASASVEVVLDPPASWAAETIAWSASAGSTDGPSLVVGADGKHRGQVSSPGDPAEAVLSFTVGGRILPVHPRIAFVPKESVRWGQWPAPAYRGQPLTIGAVLLTVDGSSPTGAVGLRVDGVAVDAKKRAAGAWADLTPKAGASTVSVQATLNGKPWGAPRLITLVERVDSERSGMLLTGESDGETLRVTLLPRTALGATSPDATFGLGAKVTLDAGEEPLPATFQFDGERLVASLPWAKVAGRRLSATVDGVPLAQTAIPRDPQAITAADVSVERSWFGFFHRHLMADGQDIVPLWFTIRDADGQDLPIDDPSRLTVEPDGGDTVGWAVVSLQEGLRRHYFAWIRVPGEPGTISARLLLDGQPTGLEGQVEVRAPVAPSVLMSGSALGIADADPGALPAGSSHTVEFIPRDASGNRTGSGMDVCLELEGARIGTPVYGGFGRYVAALEAPSDACTGTLIATVDGESRSQKLVFVGPSGEVSTEPCADEATGCRATRGGAGPTSPLGLMLFACALLWLLRRSRPLRVQRSLLLLALFLGACAGPDDDFDVPLGEPELPPPSLGDTWTIVPVDFDAHPLACPEDAPALDAAEADPAVPPADPFQVLLGTISDGSFVPAADMQPIEIVHGPQGGIHIEVGFQVTLPSNYDGVPVVHARASGQAVQPCCDGGIVGAMVPHKVILYPHPSTGEYTAAEDRVIFYNANAGHFADQECCVALEVGVAPPGELAPTQWTYAAARFFCVNIF